MILDVGRVCKKVNGSDAGKTCVVVEAAKDNRVTIAGQAVKRRKVNALDLEPLPNVLDIKKGADDKAVLDALKKAGL